VIQGLFRGFELYENSKDVNKTINKRVLNLPVVYENSNTKVESNNLLIQNQKAIPLNPQESSTSFVGKQVESVHENKKNIQAYVCNNYDNDNDKIYKDIYDKMRSLDSIISRSSSETSSSMLRSISESSSNFSSEYSISFSSECSSIHTSSSISSYSNSSILSEMKSNSRNISIQIDGEECENNNKGINNNNVNNKGINNN
ncbi:hypothetical protein PBK173_000510100, partial [Plasmodium berghei]